MHPTPRRHAAIANFKAFRPRAPSGRVLLLWPMPGHRIGETSIEIGRRLASDTGMTTLNYGNGGGIERRVNPTFSIPSILAILCAIGSFFVSGAGTMILLAILAALFGVIGVVIAILPGKRGGLISTLSIVISAIALIVAVVRIINHAGATT